MDLPANIPLKLYEREVLDKAGVSLTKWKKMQAEGIAPLPKYRGRGGKVYLGIDIAMFFGLVDESKGGKDNDPFRKGLEKLGNPKRKASEVLRNPQA